MLALGRALMGLPRLLLLDEPSLGLAPKIVESIFAILAELHRDGMSLLIVEQNVHAALDLVHAPTFWKAAESSAKAKATTARGRSHPRRLSGSAGARSVSDENGDISSGRFHSLESFP